MHFLLLVAVAATPLHAKEDKTQPIRIETFSAHQSFVQRCEVNLTPAQRTALADEKLRFLPHFGEQKPDTTLRAYVDAMWSGLAERRRALLPVSLEAFLKRSEAERRQLDTLVEPGTSSTKDVIVVWLDADRWYVDRMFYRFASFDPLRLPREKCIDVVEGSLADFLRFSPLIAPRRLEQYSPLQHPALPYGWDPSLRVLELSRSPGISDERSWSLTVLADGTYQFALGISAGKEPHRLTTLLLAARRAGLHRPAVGDRAPSFAHDATQTTLRLHFADGGSVHTLVPGAAEPRPVVDFIQSVKRAYGLEDGR